MQPSAVSFQPLEASKFKPVSPEEAGFYCGKYAILMIGQLDTKKESFT